MKKLFLLSSILIGTAAASQAGVGFHIGLPLPPLRRIVLPVPHVVVERPRFYVAPPVCAPGPVVVAPPAYYAPPGYYAPPMIYGPRVAIVPPLPFFRPGWGHYGYRR